MTIKDYILVGTMNVILTFLFGLVKDWIVNKLAKNKESQDTMTNLQTELTAEKLIASIATAIKPLETKIDNLYAKVTNLGFQIEKLETKVDKIGTKPTSVAEDVAFLKGKEEARRELAIK